MDSTRFNLILTSRFISLRVKCGRLLMADIKVLNLLFLNCFLVGSLFCSMGKAKTPYWTELRKISRKSGLKSPAVR